VITLRRAISERRLGKVFVSTVDGAQGSEAETVLLSFVRARGSLGFLQVRIHMCMHVYIYRLYIDVYRYVYHYLYIAQRQYMYTNVDMCRLYTDMYTYIYITQRLRPCC